LFVDRHAYGIPAANAVPPSLRRPRGGLTSEITASYLTSDDQRWTGPVIKA
jgi:hypothetical protein